MRGCLSVLVLALLFGGGAIWFGGPPLASELVRTTMTGSGFTADALDVDVIADPPLTLAIGRASRISIDATAVVWHKLHVASVALTLGSVDLVSRTAATADGRLGGVELSGPGGDPIVADVELSGPASAARTTIRVDPATVNTVALAAFQAEFGIRPSSAALEAPDVVRVNLGGLSLSGRLSVAPDGSVVALANGSTIHLFAPDPSLPLHLTGLAAAPEGLVLSGTLDVGALMR